MVAPLSPSPLLLSPTSLLLVGIQASHEVGYFSLLSHSPDLCCGFQSCAERHQLSLHELISSLHLLMALHVLGISVSCSGFAASRTNEMGSIASSPLCTEGKEGSERYIKSPKVTQPMAEELSFNLGIQHKVCVPYVLLFPFLGGHPVCKPQIPTLVTCFLCSSTATAIRALNGGAIRRQLSGSLGH